MPNKTESFCRYLTKLSRTIIKNKLPKIRVNRRWHKASLIALLLLSIGAGAQHLNQITTLKNIQIKKTGVSIANLQLNAPSLAVGQRISASYQFIDFLSGDPRDASVYLWGVKGSTATQVGSTGQTISQSGVVPARVLRSTDLGSILEVSVQARNASGKKGNTLTVATDSSGNSQGGSIYDGSIAPSINNLVLTGQLSIGQTLSATYQFNTNGGNAIDKTSYVWGRKGSTVGQIASASPNIS